MVLAQQQLEQDTPPSVSSKFETDKENEWEKEGSIAREKFGGPHEGDFTVSDVSLSASVNVLSSAPSTGIWAERVSGEETLREKGKETLSDIQPETELAERRSRASGQQGNSGGRVSLREISEAAGGRVGVVPASETAHILMASADSAESNGGSVPWGHSETFASVHLQRRGDDVMGRERVHGISNQTIRFASASLKTREGMRGEGVGVLGGKSAESVNGLTGRRGPCLIVGENRLSCEIVCEGPKRRRLSSLSVPASESQSDRRGGEEAVVTGRGDAVFCLSTVPQRDPSLPRLSFDSVKVQNPEVVCHREAAVCGSVREEGGMEKEPIEGEGSLGELREPAGPTERSECPHTHRHTDNRDDVTSSRAIQQQQPARRVSSNGGIGVGGVGKKRAHTGEVKRDRHGNILCPHEKRRSRCKECGGKSICKHGRQRSQCKDCGGKGICEHGRIRSQCKECGGKSVCEHGRQRSKCKECGGKSICEHGRQRPQYKECGGKSICEHGQRRHACKDCGGKSFCEHGRLRSQCKECGGK
uniref:CR-type domain-containing protein n=1 Tax=Chromera velia CCMP2878 TaxID=1169474 RepID=A0A0G4HDD6_9ALVE|eukprot:Cvel_6437.t1-p1 / transcript=Cvel_6437.t1 / gene=Cvel_6437 / organism=Chromera_velia_CCMP2878 / gene_product=Zinc finger protein 283, putative / transcript_product=Zinc finger protein 283, putative / location=Cvel_scaffold315:28936-30531(-) / protein_length=532 / sequence_SO=supercontig / SO=protein_coding / is_pseudo=false